MSNTETVRALISAFNVHNYARNTVKTNFTLQSRYGKDCIVVSFDKGMKDYQCSEYLYNIKRKIVGEFYGIEEGDTDEVVLNTAKLIFDVKSFPFNDYQGDWSVDKQGRIEFVAPIDQGIIFNLKSHLASSLKKDILEDMRVSSTTIAFNEKKYLWHDEFDNKELCKQFERGFLSRMRERYENVPKNPLKVKGNSVYIKDVFNDARFIDSVTRRVAWLIGRDLQADSKSRSDVRAFKDLIMEILDPSTRVVTSAFLCASPLNREETSILIPVILSNRGTRFLTKEEARDINHKFNNPVLDDISDKTQATFKVNGSSGIYGIDFSNKEISHCVITKIIESSVINKDHELSIDPERALSPVQSPFNSPTHAGPSGLRTPPNQRRSIDSGIGESPPKPKDSGSSSGGPGPSTELSDIEWESPTPSHDGALKESPRQGSEKPLLHDPVNLAGPSKRFSPSPRLGSIAVSDGVSGISSSSQSVGAAQNVPAGFNLRSQSRPSSWKGANPVGANPWAQQTNPCLSQGTSENKWTSSMQFTKPGLSGLLWSQSGPSSWKGINIDMSKWTSTLRSYSSLPPLIPSSGGIIPRFRSPTQVSFSESSSSKGASERRTSDKPLTEEEKELIKALLYWFNFNNQIFECHHTNFIVENGKIASLVDDSVNVEEYLQEVIDKTKEEYRVNEKEAYDLNEFPFKFLSNCEKNQETTVVANISCGALFNLKKLFIQEHEKKVEIEDIDINIVKKAVKSKKDEWVDSQVKERRARPREAITTCYPDESKLEHIPIIKGKDKYYLDRTFETWEVESFMEERWPAKGTRNTTTTFKKIEESKKDDSSSGYSSGFVTDAEKVNPNDEPMDYQASSHVQQQNLWSDDEGNSSESSRSESSNSSSKRALELGVKNLRISTELDATKTEQQCSPAKKSRSN